MSLTEFKGGTMENLLPINCRWGGAGGGGVIGILQGLIRGSG